MLRSIDPGCAPAPADLVNTNNDPNAQRSGEPLPGWLLPCGTTPGSAALHAAHMTGWLIESADNGTHMLMTASRPIKKGEEVTNNYQPHVIHRPDMSLHIYGEACGEPRTPLWQRARPCLHV